MKIHASLVIRNIHGLQNPYPNVWDTATNRELRNSIWSQIYNLLHERCFYLSLQGQYRAPFVMKPVRGFWAIFFFFCSFLFSSLVVCPLCNRTPRQCAQLASKRILKKLGEYYSMFLVELVSDWFFHIICAEHKARSASSITSIFSCETF